jgi:prophage DNA circulation protein
MKMSWLERYRQASFRNVEFYVPTHDHSGGRRNAIHELPGRDEPDVRDLGSRIKKFTIEAYVIGADYNYARDSLLEALDKGGAGKLVHPYLGTMRVAVESYNLREQSDERRIARFSLSFVQAGLQKFPTTEVAPAELVAQRKEEALQATLNDFALNFDLTSKAFSIVSNVKENLDVCIERMEKYRRVASVAADFQKELNEIKGSVTGLAYDGYALGSSFLSLINFGSDLGEEEFELTPANARVQYDEQRTLWQSFDKDMLNLVNESDPSIAVIALMQRGAVISAAGLFSVMHFTSWDEARENQRVLFDKIQALADAALDDEVHAALIDLRAAVFKDFEAREVSLPRLVIYTPPETTNSLFLSYYLYGDISREQEILDRNAIEHPGFVQGQRSLEVILDVD